MLKSLFAFPLCVAGVDALAQSRDPVGEPAVAELEVEAASLQSTGVRHDADNLDVLRMRSDLSAYAGQARRIFVRYAASSTPPEGRFLYRDDGGQHTEPGLTDALGRTWFADRRKLVDVRRFGTAKDNDYTSLLMRALEEPDVYAWIPPGLRASVIDAALPSNATMVIDGTVEMPPSAPMRAAIFTNADPERGNSHISLVGNGGINGAKALQAAQAEHELIRLTNCSSVAIDLARAGGNRFSPATRERSGAAVHVLGGRNHLVSIDRLEDYGREGIWLSDVSDSTVCDTETHGGAESWSGVQVGGPSSARNLISKVATYIAGASGIGCDSRQSLVVDCSSHSNAYFHGFNFGHAGQPADDTTGLRLLSTNAGTRGTAGADFNGFSIVNGSRRVRLVDCVAKGAFKDGFSTSAGADESMLVRCHASGSGRYGVNAYGATVVAQNCSFDSNAGGSVSPPGSGRVVVR
ncbi:right-handed parallel beta-helix repeat-containing protein [Caballeronia sp. LZ025]|uniref:right-handed parallel beta-helix repeat-containing protein n=1 Tax=Caballeronia TaxID=1827195 RepID=UPI001FD33E9B|nr:MULTISPECIES: right-handed parallel beta-helix repeat-containing protein [Caballeronia]MDR5733109.1 right-handed parallel beta-helix repeat-containing protein [Caballeronia sp. LZ025]